MATFEKTLSSKKREDGKRQILVRVSSGRNVRFRVQSGIYVSEEFWDAALQTVVVPPRRRTNVSKVQMAQQEQAALNTYLRDLVSIINSAIDQGEQPSKEWVEDCSRLSAILGDPRNHFMPDATGSVYTFPNIQRAMQMDTIAAAEAAKKEQEEEENKPMRIYDAIPLYCERQGISKNRTKTYNTLKGQLQRFEYYQQLAIDKGFVLDTKTISPEVIERFRVYLKGEKKLQEQNPRIFSKLLSRYPIVIRSKRPSTKEQRTRPIEQRSDNTVVGQLKRLAAICHWLQKMEQIDTDVFQNVTIGQERYATPFYLSEFELMRIEAFDMSNQSVTLQRQKDVMLLHAEIGARVSDFYGLSDNNIVDGFIRYVPQKTTKSSNTTARVPLSPRALRIIEKYGGIDKLKQHLPCKQQYNEDIREVLKVVGITRGVIVRNQLSGKNEVKPICEVATSHILRKTFCGNLYKTVRDPNLVSAMSGHSENSRAFARYREIQDDDLRAVMDLRQTSEGASTKRNTEEK